MPRLFVTVLSAAVLSMVAVACSSGSDSAGSSGVQPSGGDPEGTTSAAAGQTSESGDAPSGKPLRLKVAVASPGLPFLQLYVADQKGYYKARNLTVEFVNVEGSAASMAALQGGSADATVSLPEGAVTAQAQGAPIKIIGATVKESLYGLYVAKGINSIDDLVGKKIAMLTEGNGTDIQARKALDLAGQGADKSTFVATGGLPNRLAAIENNQAQGALLFPPFDALAEAQGLKSVLSLREISPGYPDEVIAVREAALTDKADALQAFIDALSEASHYIVDNPDDAAAIAVDLTGSEPDIVDKSLKGMIDTYSLDMGFDIKGLADTIASMEKYAQFENLPTAEELYDSRFIKK